MPYLVDTNIIIDMTRNNEGVIGYLDSLEGDWSISAITSLELFAGARNQREMADIDIMVSAYNAIPPTVDITRRAYYLMKTYAKSNGVGTIDSLIAATAIEEGFTLATKNKKHFQMIDGLDLHVPNY